MKYPKLALLGCSIILAFIAAEFGVFHWLGAHINGYGYLTMFVGGLLFSFGFTTPFAIGIFIETSHVVHPLYGALIGGFGAFLSDYCIFSFSRWSLRDELHRLGTSAAMRKLFSLVHHPRLSQRVRLYLLWSIAGFIIASPLPDEIGVTLLGGATTIKPRTFAFICYCFNTCGIFVMLWLAS